ncbi:MAG: ABC transporter permease [Candidatus Asgardarchaeia archaeon]
MSNKYFELLQLSYEALSERKLRASLTILMVVIGTSLLVAVDGISTGTVSYINSQIEIMGVNILVVTPRSSDVTLDDNAVSKISQIDGVYDVVPFYQQVANVFVGGDSKSVVVIGIEQEKLHLVFPSINVEKGTIVSESDRVGALLGYSVVYERRGVEPWVSVGQSVKIVYAKSVSGETQVYSKSFIVRGVLDYLGSGIIPVDQSIFVPLSVAESFFDKKGKYDGLYVITEDPSLNDAIMDEITSMYSVLVISPKTIIDTIKSIENAVTLFSNNIATISLLVAAVGIITTLWTSVLERIREIGILKAIGFKESDILFLFLGEALIIGIFGALMGIATGVGLAYGLRLMFKSEISEYVRPLFLPTTFIESFLLSVILSVIAGIYPSWRASKLDPVVALRHE